MAGAGADRGAKLTCQTNAIEELQQMGCALERRGEYLQFALSLVQSVVPNTVSMGDQIGSCSYAWLKAW